MVFGTIILSFVVFAIVLIYCKYHKASLCLRKIPGPRGLPIIGNLLEVAMEGDVSKNLIPYFMKVVEKYGSRSKLYFGWSANLILANAEDVEKILSSNILINKADSYKLAEEFMGFCLTVAGDEAWKRKRKLTVPSFNFQMLEKFVEVMDKQSKVFVKILNEKSKERRNFDVVPLIDNLTLDTITETAMGCQMGFQYGNNQSYQVALRELCLLLVKRMFNPLLQVSTFWKMTNDSKTWDCHIKALRNTTENVISERKKKRVMEISTKLKNESELDHKFMGKTAKAFLDNLLDLQEDNRFGINDEELFSETNLFIAAGYETVSSVVQCVFMRIGYHLDTQRKMQEEIDNVYDTEKVLSLTLNDLRKLDYMEMVIKEVMRLHPVLPLIPRYLNAPLKLDEKTTIPKGVAVFIFIHALHRDPKVFPNPNEFIPERFSNEEITKRHSYAYAPFSLGPRNCPGNKFAMMEIKMILAHTLKHFNIKVIPKPEQFAMEFTYTSKPRGGVQIELISRQ